MRKRGIMKNFISKENTLSKKAEMKAFSFCCTYIDTIGYDAQRGILEIKLNNSDKIRSYKNVPEDIWYQFRESANPDIYYRRCICGYFPETVYHAHR